MVDLIGGEVDWWWRGGSNVSLLIDCSVGGGSGGATSVIADVCGSVYFF